MTVTLSQLPAGTDGTRWTLTNMADLVRAGVVDPAVRDVALTIVRGCRPRDYRCELVRLREWLRQRIRFRRDPQGIEWTISPSKQLAIIRGQGFVEGDCDDAAVLAATLGRVIGFPARFVVLGFLGQRGPYSHVYAELQPPLGEWQTFDVTSPSRLPLPPNRVGVFPVL